MNTRILVKRGVEASRTTVTPYGGELLWTTDDKQLYVGDGVTAGGIAVLDSLSGKYVLSTDKGANNGIATLGADGKIPSSQLHALAIADTYVVADNAERNGLNTGAAAVNGGIHRGDIAVVTGDSKTYIASTDGGSVDGSWTELLTPSNGVQSVNGDTGPSVTLDTDDITEGSTNQYFTTARVEAGVQSFIDDNAGNGATSKLWSADKIYDELQLAGKVDSVNGAIGTVTLDGSDIDLTGYVKPGAGGNLSPGDSINVALGKLEKDLENAVAGGGEVNVQANWSEGDASSDAYIQNKPTSVTDFDITDAGSKSIITAVERTKLTNIESGAQKNVKADWNESITTEDSYIKNKPTVPATFVDEFKDLSDVAAGYVGKPKHLVITNAAADGLEYVDATEINGGTF